MTQPMTGTDWTAGGFTDIHKPFIERGGLQAVFIRDNRGAATDISPFEDDCVTVKWSPFAQDGKIRDDLFIRRKVNGKYEYNTDPNEGWWHIGCNPEDGGAERTPDVMSDDLMVLQSKFPVDSEVTEKSYSVRFVALGTADPLIHRLESELPLCDNDGNPLVALPGTPDYGEGPLLDADSAEYQLLLLYARRTSGGFIYRAEGYPAVKLDDQASKQRSKTDPDTADLTYKVLPNEYFMRPDPAGTIALVPGYFYVWMGGPGWAEQYSDGS
ncbi:major tail subunit [Mycobacterium phage SiSi]|uniref:Major tail subunit n=1 Tax=Mycobacterium phage SiSi TaxID=1327777 RepID=R4JIK4_9CAUD|nr:major tail protein [Mycobacterium phage SiSi]AGK87847.1 major tail subunit [Mycobacterium phage SiSi]